MCTADNKIATFMGKDWSNVMWLKYDVRRLCLIGNHRRVTEVYGDVFDDVSTAGRRAMTIRRQSSHYEPARQCRPQRVDKQRLHFSVSGLIIFYSTRHTVSIRHLVSYSFSASWRNTSSDTVASMKMRFNQLCIPSCSRRRQISSSCAYLVAVEDVRFLPQRIQLVRH